MDQVRRLGAAVPVLDRARLTQNRLLLASVAPLIMAEFHLTTEAYGWLLSGLALAYATEGAKVALTARTVSELDVVVGEIQKAGVTALALPADLSDPRDQYHPYHPSPLANPHAHNGRARRRGRSDLPQHSSNGRA